MLIAPTAMATEIISHSGMNSCNKGWYHTSGTFLNYCPDCGATGTLRWNPKGTIEGEWTCAACSADYCVCGQEKTSGRGKHLIKTSNNSQIKPNTPPQSIEQPKTQPRPVDIVKQSINKHYLNIYV